MSAETGDKPVGKTTFPAVFGNSGIPQQYLPERKIMFISIKGLIAITILFAVFTAFTLLIIHLMR